MVLSRNYVLAGQKIIISVLSILKKLRRHYMKTFNLTVSWEVDGFVEVKVETLEEAVDCLYKNMDYI